MKKKKWIFVSEIVFLLLCSILVFAVGISSYLNKFNTTLREENQIRMSETSESIRAYMNAVVTDKQRALTHISSAIVLMPEEKRLDYLKQAAQEEGLVYLGYAGADGVMYSTLSSETRDISETEYFRASMSGERAVTGVVRELLETRAVSGIILSTPLPEQQGVLVAMLDLRQLEDALEVGSFGGEGYAYIIDKEGNLLLYKRSMDYHNFFSFLQNVTFEKGYSGEMLFQDIGGGRAGFTCYSIFNVKRYAYYCPLGFNDWTVVNIVAKDVITGKTDALIFDLIRLCVITVAVFTVLLGIIIHLYNRSHKQEKANQAKTDFLSSMSHDIRTPMNAIIGMTNIAINHIDNREKVSDCLKKISLSGNHLLALINDILDISKIESGKLTLTPLNFSLRNTVDKLVNIVRPMIREKSQEFEVHIHKMDYEVIYADELRINQIFINILSNAVKYTPEGGRIVMELSEELLPEGQSVRLTYVVRDNGLGMSKEFLRTMYDAFSRATDTRTNKIRGSGLGLAIVKQIVTLMDGDIECESELNKGTTFTVTLDLPLGKNEEDQYVLPGVELLLVDDDEIFLEITKDALIEMQMKAETANSGPAALELVKDRHARGDDYDVIIVDWKMPEMDGLETTRAIRDIVGAGAVIILVSSYDWTDMEEDVEKCGANGFISKPLFKSYLYERIHDVLGSEEEVVTITDEDEVDFSGCHILVAEDNELNWEVVSELLSMYSITAERAENGKVCVDMLEAAPEGTYDLVLMDVQMPVMDGREATRTIRKSQKPYLRGIPVIAMTADAFAEDIAACLGAGMNDHISKPLDMQILQKALHKYLQPDR